MSNRVADDARGNDYFVRFNVRQRIEHIALMVIFTTLAITGLLQRFYTGGVAEWTILRLGGIETVRAIHRFFGGVFTFALVYHLVMLTIGLLVRHERQTMLPTRKDFTDIVDSLRFGLGFSPRHPQFGRFNYRQKFEYWGLMFGSAIITATGLILMFPVLITKILPGQFVAASVEIHGWEATLAVLTIVVWHFYEVMIRPDVFPADSTIFTGRISRERMIEEHYLNYVELTGDETAGPQIDTADNRPNPRPGAPVRPPSSPR
jgi:formate dehydrogenase subunit gamma